MKTLVAIPCGDTVPADTLQSVICLRVESPVQFTLVRGSLVYDARNRLAEIAMGGDFDRILYLDSDMVFEPDMLTRFHGQLDEGKEVVCGLYTTRKPPIQTTLYSAMYLEQEPGAKFSKPVLERMEGYPLDTPFRVKGCGFAGVMLTVDVLRRITETFGAPFSPLPGFGEDLSFCLRAADLGIDIWCDPRIRFGHVGVAVYYPEKEADQ